MKRIKTLDDVPAISAYLSRIGAEPRSLRTAVVTEKSGKYWKDIAVITIDGDTGIVSVPSPEYAPSETEQHRITDEVKQYQWPVVKLVKTFDLPEKLKGSDPDTLFEFRDASGSLLMLQHRMDLKDGDKKYVPWTYWDDEEWRAMEPEGKLPLWGLDQLNDHTTVFIHEGAKAARAVRRMVEAQTATDKARLKGHPWGEELSGAAHLGWIGGALSPGRTDWTALARLGVKRAYIVSDNDAPGVQAVKSISFHLYMPTFHVQFTNDWPASFDLADEFPKKMFASMEGKTYYTGPSFRSCLHPATWATDKKVIGKTSTTILRDHFKDMWAYVEEVDLFVCIDMPEIIRSDKIANNMLAAFSHVKNTTDLMVKAYRGRSTKLCYRPDLKGRVVTDKTTSAINLHTPTQIKSASGDVTPFLDFMKYLFPNEVEREEVLRWCATLIAKPEIRMVYALLLVSEKQGVGKTTLGASILAPLVGDQNSAFPTEDEIVNSNFNGWLANKRLIIVGEIYSGHSWKAYNRLKGLITDKDIEVNEKYQRPYRVENWAQFFVCSNSRRALKMEDDDRRWFYPTITEVAWPKVKFMEFNQWLNSGGLGIIKAWADSYSNYVQPGARAPMTLLKHELIEASRSEAQREVADLALALLEEHRPIALAMKEVEGWVKASVEGKVFDTDYELRKTMVECGCFSLPRRIKAGGRLQYCILTPELQTAIQSMSEGEANETIRKAIVQPNTLIRETM